MLTTPYSEITNHIQTEVFPHYVPEQSDASQNVFFYAYRIAIRNEGTTPVQLLNRHWIIRNGKGKEEHVRGEGVVGQKPVLYPGESFEYTSFCPLNTPTGNMRGKFEMLILEDAPLEGKQKGERFWANVPVFFLRPPLDQLS